MAAQLPQAVVVKELRGQPHPANAQDNGPQRQGHAPGEGDKVPGDAVHAMARKAGGGQGQLHP